MLGLPGSQPGRDLVISREQSCLLSLQQVTQEHRALSLPVNRARGLSKALCVQADVSLAWASRDKPAVAEWVPAGQSLHLGFEFQLAHL